MFTDIIKKISSKESPTKEYIIGLDVGGTHTDAVVIGKQGIINQAKVPTNQSDLFNSVWSCLENVTKGISYDKIHRVVLSTTLTTNAIVENKLKPVGMIVISGPGIDPEYFRPCTHYFTITGSIDHRGREIVPINRNEVEIIASRLTTEGIRHVGVVGKFSTKNPSQEMQIREILKSRFDYVIMSHNLSGNLNFPRRIATTYLNAAIYPIHKQFFEAVRSSLQQKGIKIPIYILKADAGTMNFKSSLHIPGQTILSGPAASVMGSLPYASDQHDTLVLDIGGTTTDMAVLVNKIPLLDMNGIELGGYKTLIRSLQTRSIGLGGDSAVRVINGKLTIGPDRLGKAMAFGGEFPTPTDALFVLDEQHENGDKHAAIKGYEQIANQLNTTPEIAARQVFDTSCRMILDHVEKMIKEINSKPVYTVHEVLEGKQIELKELLILGGPAPFFAKRLKDMSSYEVRTVPQWGVANAIGAALARTTCQVILFADTEQGKVTAPEENYSFFIDRNYSINDALKQADKLLKEKAIKRGAKIEDIETEILEKMQFNMVRGFYTTGRNIRVKVQVKPGLIKEFGTEFLL